jgi:hypothetical protein
MHAARLMSTSGGALLFLMLVGCVQPGYDSQVAQPTMNGFAQAQAGAPGGGGSDLIAAHQADRAAMQACLQRVRQASLAGASSNEILQMRQNCISHGMRTRREIAKLDEQLGRQAESASYWQASLELENARNERVAKMEAAARRAFIDRTRSEVRIAIYKTLDRSAIILSTVMVPRTMIIRGDCCRS